MASKMGRWKGILNAAGNLLIKYIRTTNVWRRSAVVLALFAAKKE